MWQQPKTDWIPQHYFNVKDYNRIKGNLEQIRSLAQELYPVFPFEEMGRDKVYDDYGFYADEINRFESNLEHICSGTYPFAIGNRNTYYDNQPFLDWQELNRLESACRLLYENLLGQKNGRARLAVVPGRRREPKC